MSRFLQARLGIALLLLAAGAVAVAADSWRSPDGALVLILHDEWEQGHLPSFDQYGSTSRYLTGSDHRLLAGGLLRKRYITLQVVHRADLEGNAVPAWVDVVTNTLRDQGHEVVFRESTEARAIVMYRFIHTGDPVSQVVFAIGTETGTFLIEMTAPRQDEARLQQEAGAVGNSVVVLRPPGSTAPSPSRCSPSMSPQTPT